MSLWFGIGLLACAPVASPTPDSAPPVAPGLAPSSASPASSAPDEPVAEENWDPHTPLELRALQPRRMYVIVDRSALCPTRQQAQARECGNSVEFKEYGTIEWLGQAVFVVGDQPVAGFWRALRYQKAGVLPGWIRADDVAELPRTDHLDAFDQRGDVAKAVDAASLSSAELSRLAAGTVVVWKRTHDIRTGSFDERVFVYTPHAAIELPAPSGERTYVENHSCLLYGDCLELAYVCDAQYCDEVSVIARATGLAVAPPVDPTGRRPTTTERLPLFELISLADRFGTCDGKLGAHPGAR